MRLRADMVPVIRVPRSIAPSAEAARYPGLGEEGPSRVAAERATLVNFKARFLPHEDWKPYQISPTTYLKSGEVTLAGKNTVLVAVNDFNAAEEAWTYLSSIVGKTSPFPGRGGTVAAVINGINALLSQVEGKYGTGSSKWLWIGLAAVGAVVLWRWFGKGKH